MTRSGACNQLLALIRDRMVTVENGVTCHSGENTTTYLDIPGALNDGQSLKLAVNAFLDHLAEHPFDLKGLSNLTAIAGPQMGAIPLVMGFAMSWSAEMKWAIVRDAVKDHGLGRAFVGAELGPKDTVILTDDVVSTGSSLEETIEQVMATGAKILAVIPLVDRGTTGRQKVEDYGIPYLPVLTYQDLGLAPLGVK